MGYLDFKDQPEHLAHIKKILARRGLKPCIDEEWEIHGPHQGMNYQVYVGLAKTKKIQPGTGKKEYYCVVIYPRAVYMIYEHGDWYKPQTEDRITVG